MSSYEIEINLDPMPSGKRYEDTYGEYLNIFHRIAFTEPRKKILVRHPPATWVPLLHYLNCNTYYPVVYFPEDAYIRPAIDPNNQAYENLPKLGFDGTTVIDYVDYRTTMEAICGMRPELVDALWKCDMQWKTNRTANARRNWMLPKEKVIKITNNGSFHRREITDFMAEIDEYTPTKSNVILVPCAADKPYPAMLHQAVIDLLTELHIRKDWYLATATGVLGIVPEDLWDMMPNYDSGMPNEWRLMQRCRDYFYRNVHDNIVIYSDYYHQAIQVGLNQIAHDYGSYAGKNANVWPVTENKFYYDYLPLHEKHYMDVLRTTLVTVSVQK